MKNLNKFMFSPGRIAIAGAPEGFDALVLSRLAATAPGGTILHVARDDRRMARMAEALAFFAPALEVLTFPAWDCVPYDRVSPNGEVVARRIETLARLAGAGEGVAGEASAPEKGAAAASAGENGTGEGGAGVGGAPEKSEAAGRGRVVVTTVSALLQRLPPRAAFAGAGFAAARGDDMSLEALVAFLDHNGYVRTETVREPGEYAVRGGIVDLFPPGHDEPLRLDLFGDVVDAIRVFDPVTQRSSRRLERVALKPVSEVLLNADSIARFRSGYRELFGAVAGDPLYEAVSAGRRFAGMEHWLPLYFEGLETLFDYLPEAAVTLDHQAEAAMEARLETIADYYAARTAAATARLGAEAVYRPLPPERLYLDRETWDGLMAGRPVAAFSPFAEPDRAAGTADGAVDRTAVDAGGRPGRDFADVRAQPDTNLFDALREAVAEEAAAGRRTVIACYGEGSRTRLAGLLRDHGMADLGLAESWPEAAALGAGRAALVVLGLERGFRAPDALVVSEQDIFGDRLARPARRRRRAEQVIAEAGSLAEGDIVVHVDHGIGRYAGLETLDVAGAPHDCLKILYAGDDKLFVPVENIEVLSRYGSEESGVQLDRLGGAAWQARKARIKKRVRDIAGQLLRIAAERELREATELLPPEGLFDEFCARFPYPETEDQIRAIEDAVADLSSGRPMDRLICGDVGFGKTEVALRAAFIAVMSGSQVAVVTPTTLLCRQHLETFRARFKGLPVRIEQLSRLTPSRRAAEVRAGLASGQVDIIIGTHALLGENVTFRNLGLLVVDEEQHFGVAQKERLKRLKADVHVLTLTATPIPRTLQMALTGVKEMSLIATPPVDRLAVRTFVLPFDPVIVREAILREHYRGGQSFYICPRIEDLPAVAERLAKLVPEVKVAVAHGRLAARRLEEVMTAFYDGAYDVLLSTSIIESGLDIPTANTMIIHRADMFGLGQLYQLRGRIGRSKLRAYAYLTLPPGRMLSAAATRRLEALQALDSLGAGFSLASQDLDIRGAGNLLGSEQTGHIREVGIELYQHMLEEAVAAARATSGGAGGPGAAAGAEAEESWTPQITIGTPVLIPESFVADLGVRLSLYRRIAYLQDRGEIEAFAAELIDRFGPLPREVENLLEIVAIKQLCRQARVEKAEAGPKGAVLSFRDGVFPNPAGLVEFIASQAGTVKLRPDHRLVYRRAWGLPGERIGGLQHLLKRIAEIARAAPPSAGEAVAGRG